MAAKKRKKDRDPSRRRATGETQTADGLTVAWMMSVVTTALCGAIGIPVVLIARGRAGAEGARMFGALLHFSGFVAAVISLVLLAFVLKVRRQPLPPAITWTAVAIALAVIGTTLMY